MKKRILVVSDSATLHTGFGNIARKILLYLHQTGEYELGQLAWFHKDTDIKLPEEIAVYPTTKEDFFGATMFEAVVADFKPDIVFTISDLFMVYFIPNALMRNSFKWVGYVPVDGEPLLPNVLYNVFGANILVEIKNILDNINCLVSYSEFGKRIIDESNFAKTDKVIYCGVDTEIFKPVRLAKKADLKAGFLGLPKDSFVVGFVGRNSVRKRPDRLFEAFAKFAKGKNKVFLYMHCALQDFTGFQLPELAKEYGIADKVAFNNRLEVGQGFSDSILAMYYNALDLMVLPTSSEGFCLPLLEAMSCGVPILATDYSAHVEWCNKGGMLIPVKEFIREPRTNTKRALVDIEKLSEGIELFYSDKMKRRFFSESGREKALTMDWKNVLVQWEVLFDSIEASSKEINKPNEKTGLIEL